MQPARAFATFSPELVLKKTRVPVWGGGLGCGYEVLSSLGVRSILPSETSRNKSAISVASSGPSVVFGRYVTDTRNWLKSASRSAAAKQAFCSGESFLPRLTASILTCAASDLWEMTSIRSFIFAASSAALLDCSRLSLCDLVSIIARARMLKNPKTAISSFFSGKLTAQTVASDASTKTQNQNLREVISLRDFDWPIRLALGLSVLSSALTIGQHLGFAWRWSRHPDV